MRGNVRTRRGKGCRHALLCGRKSQKAVIWKAGINRLRGSHIKVTSVKYVRRAMMLCAGVASAGMLFVGTQVKAAGEAGQFRSQGVIHYTNAEGQEIILDTEDLQVLFQYAAEGKGGLSQALSGVGTKLVQDEAGFRHSRDPEAEASVKCLQTRKELQAVSFDLLLQALAESQTLPSGYEESYTLACADNITLGRAAWSDGSLARGNNRDLIEHYMRGWLEGSGCTDYEAIYDEEGRWIGYRER